MTRYIHDCDACQSLGEYGGADLYFCPGILGGSLIARYGDDAPAYASMPVDVLQDNRESLSRSITPETSALVEALTRHERRWTTSHLPVGRI